MVQEWSLTMAIEQNIFTAASDAIEEADRTKHEVAFSFMGTETRAKPNSCMADVVEIWFWKRQFEQWQKAVGR
jgi:hypothetical protein